MISPLIFVLKVSVYLAVMVWFLIFVSLKAEERGEVVGGILAVAAFCFMVGVAIFLSWGIFSLIFDLCLGSR